MDFGIWFLEFTAMRLPAIPFLTKTTTSEFFLSLIFESDKVSSILFREQEKNLNIIGTHEVKLDLNKASGEDLIVACDSVISKLEMSLPEGATLEKTIFAVPYSWIDDGKINPDKLSDLKKISTELALVPMGFIVSIEAIVAFLQKKEGAPVSGIFVELGEQTLSVFIVRSGNVIDVKEGIIEDGVEKTVEELLGRVTKLDVLPSKIVLLHNKEAEAIQQKFLSHHWTKELPFMHLPQVAILDRGFENEAIISGVASQLNVTVTDELKVESKEEIGEEERVPEQTADAFGFVQDEDIAIKKIKKEEKASEKSDIEDLSFAEVIDDKGPVIKEHGVIREDKGGEEVYEEDEMGGLQTPTAKSPGIGEKISAFFTPESLSSIPKKFGGGKNLIIPLLALIAVIVVIAAYYSAVLKATVIVFTDQKAIKEDSLGITLTTSGDSSFTEKALKISTVEEEVSGEETQETTGHKDTGQKATGTVTIFNKTELPKQLDKGTTLISSNNIEFTLNDNVTIASTSSFATSFSNASAKVTASSFGKEYNLPSQTNFTIKGVSSSDIFGRNDTAFSGGTKEEIQVVSKKDLDGLAATILKRLFDKAKSQAASKLSGDDALIPVSISSDFVSEKYDRKENDQAKSVKLSAKVTYTLGIYKKNELSKFISSSNDFDVPPDFKLDDTESSIKVSDIKKNKNDLSAKLSFNAIFKPQLDTMSMPQMVSGKTKSEALKKMKEISGVSDVSIQFSNNIPFLPEILPLNASNISIDIKTQ